MARKVKEINTGKHQISDNVGWFFIQICSWARSHTISHFGFFIITLEYLYKRVVYENLLYYKDKSLLLIFPRVLSVKSCFYIIKGTPSTTLSIASAESTRCSSLHFPLWTVCSLIYFAGGLEKNIRQIARVAVGPSTPKVWERSPTYYLCIMQLGTFRYLNITSRNRKITIINNYDKNRMVSQKK